MSSSFVFETNLNIGKNVEEDDIDRICSLWSKAKQELRKKLSENLDLKSENEKLKLKLVSAELDRDKADEKAVSSLIKLSAEQSTREENRILKNKVETLEEKLKKFHKKAQKLSKNFKKFEEVRDSESSEIEILKRDRQVLLTKIENLESIKKINLSLTKEVKSLKKDCEVLVSLLSKTHEFEEFAKNCPKNEMKNIANKDTYHTLSKYSMESNSIPFEVSCCLEDFNKRTRFSKNKKFSNILEQFLKAMNTIYLKREMRCLELQKQSLEKCFRDKLRRMNHQKTYSTIIDELERANKPRKHKKQIRSNSSDSLTDMLKPFARVSQHRHCKGMSKPQNNFVNILKACIQAIDLDKKE